MVNSHSLRRLSTASTPKIAQKCCPIVIVKTLKMYYAQMVVFIRSFQLYFIDTHIYLSFNVPHLIEKWKNQIFVVLMINVPQSNVNYVANLTISQITNHAR